MTIVEFLQARLAEDELTAQAAIDGSPGWRTYYDYRDVKDDDGHFIVLADSRYPTAAQAAHIARHSPARILRECEIKRALIADYLHRDAFGDQTGRGTLEDTLKTLATAWSGHPDYDPAWS
ncbi:MAG TPA: DUF6221 family protein [Streptosporangiaceae bacterium]